MGQFNYVKTRREDIREFKESQIPAIKAILKYATKLNVWVFKKSKGRLMKSFLGSGAPICVVGMTGAKSGVRRETALIHIPVTPGAKAVYLVASQGGMPKNPTWYYNIKANPSIDVMVAGGTSNLVARQISDEEKEAAWPRLLEVYPDFDEYQARTDRNIPVFLCE